MFVGSLPPLVQQLRESCRNAAAVMSYGVLGLLFLFLTPSWLFRCAAYLTLAAGLGLHVPTLVAGHLLYAVVGGLACAEPLLIAALLLWAAHKRWVRGQPLVDDAYWRTRLRRNR